MSSVTERDRGDAERNADQSMLLLILLLLLLILFLSEQQRLIQFSIPTDASEKKRVFPIHATENASPSTDASENASFASKVPYKVTVF